MVSKLIGLAGAGKGKITITVTITTVSQIDGTGKMICAGAGDGTTSVLKLDESLINNSKLDRNNASDMFERLDITTNDKGHRLDLRLG